MINLFLAKRLKYYIINIHEFYMSYDLEIIAMEAQRRGIKPYSDAIIQGCLDLAKIQGNPNISVMNLITVIYRITSNAAEAQWSKKTLAGCLDFSEDIILDVVIKDKMLLKDAVTYFKNKTKKIRTSLS